MHAPKEIDAGTAMAPDDEETVCMTYKELGDRLGVQHESARKLAKKRLWRRLQGNDGMGRVYVPLEYLLSRGIDPRLDDAVAAGGPPAEGADTVPADAGPRLGGPEAAMIVAQLLQQVSGLQELVAAERSRADVEGARAEAERQRAEAEGQRADAERGRADSERQRADAEGRRADEAERDRNRLREEAESERAKSAQAVPPAPVRGGLSQWWKGRTRGGGLIP